MKNTPSPRSRWRTAVRIGLILVVLYVAVLTFLLANETSLVYPGAPVSRGNWNPIGFDFEDVQFETTDGARLHGWFLPRHEPTPAFNANPASPSQEDDDVTLGETVLLCHGNAENVAMASAYIGDRIRKTLQADVFVFDYRGYGKSSGIPSEPALINDAEGALKWLSERTGKPSSEIILVGHSIGGGPACHLAAESGCKLLILQRTFNSLTSAAQQRYPVFPVRYLMKNQFDSQSRIKNYSGPVFQSHGTEDRLISIDLARELFEAAPGEPKQFWEFPGMGHWDPLPLKYWTELKGFVLKLNRK